MRTDNRHTIIAGMLAALFLIFTVGIPIMISACPMMAQGKMRASCCMATSALPAGVARVHASSSCCNQHILLSPSQAEYVRTAPRAEFKSHDYPALVVPLTLHSSSFPCDNATGNLYDVALSASPPYGGIILPLLHASLLI